VAAVADALDPDQVADAGGQDVGALPPGVAEVPRNAQTGSMGELERAHPFRHEQGGDRSGRWRTLPRHELADHQVDLASAFG
jgi:hypothetical protein